MMSSPFHGWSSRHRLARGLALGLCMAGTAQAQLMESRVTSLLGASHPWDTTTIPNRVMPVAFSFSGGISLGSYQAGVNWAMVEFFRLVRDDSMYRVAHRLPIIVPSVMTGASAGNINVLLGAVEWCGADHSRAVDQSLFWKMWVYSGWNELAPPDSRRDEKSPDPGVLDRSALRNRVMASIDTALRTRAVIHDCHVPIGVVATRIAPGQVGLDRHIEAENQRYVALFDVREADGRLRLTAPRETLLSTQSLGAQLAIPADDNGELETSRVFELVEASSAYPVAFAPVVLVYQDPDCVLHSPTPPGCRDFHHESFMDGGVFDNNPVGLANGMMRLTVPVRHPPILYVDPSATRGRLLDFLQHQEEPAKETRVDGISGLLAFAGGFIPSARKYELQAFIREQLSSDSSTRAIVQSSTRAHPVVGEHIDAFAAFFGRPFREFDFYAGVADGFQFLASEILCDPRRSPVKAGGSTSDPLKEAIGQLNCIEAETDSLLQRDLGLSKPGQIVVARVLSREFPNTFCSTGSRWLDPTCAPRTGTPKGAQDCQFKGPEHDTTAKALCGRALADDSTARALLAIEAATEDQLNYSADGPCKNPGDLPSGVLCADGFGHILDSLSHDSFFKGTISHWANDPSCGKPERSSAGNVLEGLKELTGTKRAELNVPKCRAEFLLDNLLTDSHAAVQDIIDRALHRLNVSEEMDADAGRPNSSGVAKTVDFLYRSGNLRGRRGIELDASSIPPYNSFWWNMLHFVPYYVGGSVGTAGLQAGWKPTAYFNFLHSIIDAPIEFDHSPNPDVAGRLYQWSGAVTPGVGHDFTFSWLNQLSVGPRIQCKRLNGECSAIHLQASALTLFGKVRLTAYSQRLDPGAHTRLLGSVSVSDLNGILYYLIR